LPGDSEGVYDAGLNKWVVKRNGKTVFLDAWQP